MGEEKDISFFSQRGGREINLKGSLVLPGFTDCHTHFTEYAVNKYYKYRLNIHESITFEELMELINEKAGIAPSGEWITGWGWNKNRWNNILPHKKYLDEISSRHPVALDSKDGHTLWCNSMALKIAGMDHPTGILFENEGRPVRDVIKKPSKEHYKECVKKAIKEAIASGLTGIHICEGAFEFNIYQELFRDGELNLRVTWHFPLDLLEEMISTQIKSGFGNEYIRIGCVKIFTDGSLGSASACMFENYEGVNHSGKLLIEEEELCNIVTKANKEGISCAIHAIGDKANNMVLNVYEQVGKFPGIRNRIEHSQILRPEDIKRFSENHIIASLQPIHIANDIPLAENYWGKRCSYAYPFASFLRNGVRVIFGSDVPVEDFNPFKGIYSASTRKYLNNNEKQSWYPGECINVEQSVQAYTVGAAYSSYEENIKGTIAPGNLADLIILDRNIFDIESEDILETSVKTTIISGKMIFEK
ncbi:MAG: N-substituted formamide deformylase precursor [bacterium ADurb.Bin363]|nr:MAG: N-substituted formamide deformylase precursor [bacterium ADurb.Bin363]